MTPAIPAQNAPSAKVESLLRTRSMPIASQAISSSRIASRARPTRESSIRLTTNIVMITSTSTM
jgi:hypothetical protein